MKDLNRKIPYISDMKTVALLFIIICHCAFFYDSNPFFTEGEGFESAPVSFAVTVLDMMLVEAYVFCSGYLYGRSLIKHNRTFFEATKERAKRILGNYYIYGIIWLVPLYTFFDISSYGRPDHAGYLEGYRCMLLGLFSDHLWFLWMIFWVILFFIILAPLLRKDRMLIVFVITLVTAVVISLYIQDFPYFKISQISPYLIVYYLGIWCYKHEEKIDTLSVKVLYAAAFVSLAAVIVYVYFKPEHFAFRYIAKSFGAIFVFSLFRAFADNKTWLRFTQSAAYRYMTKKRMDYYLLHMPFPYLMFRLLSPHIGSVPAICIPANFVLSFALTAAAVEIKDKIVSAVGRK